MSYTVSLYEIEGQVLADIQVTEGSMDVNAVYFGDDDFSGSSESLAGPLNMNGSRLDGDRVQWDDAEALSDPGLGPDGTEKETFVSEGDTLTIALDDVSIDDIDVFGIRATSTSNDEGSIKGVSHDPEIPEEPEDPEEPQEPLFEKVYFGTQTGDQVVGVAIAAEPREGVVDVLDEGVEPTFENYLAYYENETDLGGVPALEEIVFYEYSDAVDYPVEIFSIEAPDGGFADTEEVLAAYDAAIEAGALDDYDGEDLIAALSLPDDTEAEFSDETGDDIEDDVEFA
nr:hypothetical protein [Cognatishimia sp. F0-27]